MNNLYIRVVLFLVTLFSYITPQQEQFIFVYEHCRHGARSPGFSFDSTYTDEYNNTWFGDGELTNIGIRMSYILGIRSRLRYKNFLSPSFNSKEILITSTNSNRTLNTINAQLLGLYPLGTGPTLNEDEIPKAFPPNQLNDDVLGEINSTLENNTIIGQLPVIPIHTFDLRYKYIFLDDPENCARMKTYRQELINKSSYTKFFTKLNNTYGKELQEYFNKPNRDFLFDFNTVISITDNFIANIDNARNMETFLSYVDKDTFYSLAIELKMMFLYETQCDELTCMMAASPYFKDMITWMDSRIEMDIQGKGSDVNYTQPKMVIHGGHDTSLAPILSFMSDVFGTNKLYVPFGANVFFEVYKNNNSEYKLRYLYNDEEMLDISYEEFKRKVMENVWSNEKISKFCENEKEDNVDVMKMLVCLVIVFGLTSLILVIKTIYLYVKLQKGKKSLSKKDTKDLVKNANIQSLI